MIQNKTILIGITGGIGTGKSTVTKFIKEKGYAVLDADKIAREVVEKDMPAYKMLVEEFGSKVLREDGSLDRKMLGNIIFNDNKKRTKLNNIVHSHIFIRMKRLVDEMSVKYNIVFLDIPLLFEEYDKLKEHGILFDEIWLVYANHQTQIQRITKRDNISEESAIARINSQIDIEKKTKMASEILDNSRTIEELEKQIDKLCKRV